MAGVFVLCAAAQASASVFRGVLCILAHHVQCWTGVRADEAKPLALDRENA